jgi:hypothetical protein
VRGGAPSTQRPVVLPARQVVVSQPSDEEVQRRKQWAKLKRQQEERQARLEAERKEAEDARKREEEDRRAEAHRKTMEERSKHLVRAMSCCRTPCRSACRSRLQILMQTSSRIL